MISAGSIGCIYEIIKYQDPLRHAGMRNEVLVTSQRRAPGPPKTLDPKP